MGFTSTKGSEIVDKLVKQNHIPDICGYEGKRDEHADRLLSSRQLENDKNTITMHFHTHTHTHTLFIKAGPAWTNEGLISADASE